MIYKAKAGSDDWNKIETINLIQEVLYNIRMNRLSEDEMTDLRLKLLPYTSVKTLDGN